VSFVNASNIGLLIAGIVLLFVLVKWINVIPEYERGVVFRLGRVMDKPKGPGLVIVLWPIDRMVRVDLRTVADDIPAQDVITRDNVSVKVNAVVYFRVVGPIAAIVEIERYLFATSQIAQTTLRSVLGTVDLDELLGEREKLNQRLQAIVDRQTDPWGVKVALVEVKHVPLTSHTPNVHVRDGAWNMMISPTETATRRARASDTLRGAIALVLVIGARSAHLVYAIAVGNLVAARSLIAGSGTIVARVQPVSWKAGSVGLPAVLARTRPP